MTVNLEIICIGNELLIGKISNTNATWLAKQATELGVNVQRVAIIQDVIDEIAGTLCETLKRKSRFIITTGGLGPTFDDKTLQGIAKALNRKLEVNPKALEIVKKKCIEYAKKKHSSTDIEMTPPRMKMATLPVGTEPVNNPIGTAPGVQFNIRSSVVFVLPGVPAEMKAIFRESIVPLLRQVVGDRLFFEKSLFAENIFESTLAPLIDQVMENNTGVYIKSHPMPSYIELHLIASLNREEKPAERVKKAADELTLLIRKNSGNVKS